MPNFTKVSPGPVGSICGACFGNGVSVGAAAINCGGCVSCICAGGVHVHDVLCEQEEFLQNPPIHDNPDWQFALVEQEKLQET